VVYGIVRKDHKIEMELGNMISLFSSNILLDSFFCLVIEYNIFFDDALRENIFL